jgi:hypothetical protein
MATFEAQVEGLTSLSIDSSSAPTQTELTQFLTDGAKELINIFPANLADLCSSSISFTSGSASTLNTGKVLRVFRSDGDIKQPCRSIPADYKGRYSDPDDMNYATITDPVYYVENNSLDVLPDGGTCTYSEVQYPAVTYGLSAISVFPDEAEHLVVIYAAIKSIQNAMGNKTTSLPSDIPVPSLVTVTETLPSFSPSTLSISSTAPSKPVIDTSSVTITGTAPTYSKPLIALGATPTILDLSISAVVPVAPSISAQVIADPSSFAPAYTKPGVIMVTAPTISNLSISSVPPEPPSISTASLSFLTSAPTYTTQSLTSQVSFSTFFPLSDFTDNDPGLLTVSAEVPQAPTLSASSVSFSTTAPIYNKPTLNMGSAPAILNLNVNAGSVPETPTITTVSYTDASNADAFVDVIAVPAQIDVSGNAPAFTKPTVSPEFGSVNTHLDANEDVELASVKIQEVQAQISEYSVNIQNEQAEFNKENVRYQMEFQEAVNKNNQDLQAEIEDFRAKSDIAKFNKQQDQALNLANAAKQIEDIIADNGSKLQKYSYEIQNYQAQINKEIQEYQQNLEGDLRVWFQERQTDLQKYTTDIQNEQGKFNEENIEYQAQLQISIENVRIDNNEDARKLEKFQAEISKYQYHINHQIQEYEKRFSRYETELNITYQAWAKTESDNIGKYQADIQNQMQVFNDANAEYQAELQRSIENARLEDNEESKKIQKYSAELQQYQAEVASEIQEYQQNLEGDLQVWQTERQTDLQKYGSDIQNELNEFNKENVKYQAILQEYIQEAQLSDQNEARKIQKYQTEVQTYSADVNKQVQEYQQNFQGDVQLWLEERRTDLQKYNSDIQNELNEFNKENVEYQAKLQKDIQDSQLSDSFDEREINKYSAELQQYQADVNKEVQEFTSNFQKDLEKFRADLSKYSSESERVNAQNSVALSRFTVEVNNYTAQIQKYSVDYQWLESQHQRLSADYERGIQTLIRS